jgi:hypothetical protein
MKAAAETPDLDHAIERYRRDKFLDDVNAAYASIRRERQAWNEEPAERSLWDKSLKDGLDE